MRVVSNTIHKEEKGEKKREAGKTSYNRRNNMSITLRRVRVANS